MAKPPLTKEEIESTRRRILDTALEIIIDEGFNHLSIRKIASRLKVTATTIYNYYVNKDEINLMIRVRGFEKLYGLLTKHAAPYKDIESKIKALVRAYIEFGLNNPVTTISCSIYTLPSISTMWARKSNLSRIQKNRMR